MAHLDELYDLLEKLEAFNVNIDPKGSLCDLSKKIHFKVTGLTGVANGGPTQSIGYVVESVYATREQLEAARKELIDIAKGLIQTLETQ